jgi:hypothetical protein
MTLLQIAGGQTWPNFLPLLGYRPRHVIFLTSKDPDGKFTVAIDHLRQAAALTGIQIEARQITTATSQPTLNDCQEALLKLQKEPIDLINLTGGTKAMSAAAHRFASERKIPSFHLDTRRTAQPFDDFATAPHSLPFPDLTEISQKIDVRLALKAQGFPVPVSFKTPTTDDLAFATTAAQIRSNDADGKKIAADIATLRTSLCDERGNFLRKGKLRSALQQPITATPGTPWHSYLLAAAQHGIIQQLEPAPEFLLVTLDPGTAPTDSLTSQAETHFKLLEGIWFELAVLAHLRTKSSFSDICWSVEADHTIDENANSKGETDLVAFNHNSLNLHFISCKTSGPHSSPLDHIQGLRRRATKEGGEFSKAELWIFRPKSENHRADLENHCREQNVTIRIFTEQAP